MNIGKIKVTKRKERRGDNGKSANRGDMWEDRRNVERRVHGQGNIVGRKG